MVAFGISTKDTEEFREFMRATHKRLQEKHLMRNPFFGGVYRLDNSKEGDAFYLVCMDPVWPKFYQWGWIAVIAVYVFKGWNIWILPGAILLSFSFFYSRLFFYPMLWIGARKSGHVGYVRLVGAQKILGEVGSYLHNKTQYCPAKMEEVGKVDG